MCISTVVHTKSEQLIAGFKQKDLHELLMLCGVEVVDIKGSLTGVIQEKWMCPNATLLAVCEEKREQFLSVFKRMRIVDEWINQKFSYGTILFLPSASLIDTTDRLSALQKLLKSRITFDQFVFFAVDAPLTHAQKTYAVAQGCPDTVSVEGQVYEYLLGKQAVSAYARKRCIVRGTYGAFNRYTAPDVKMLLSTWYQLYIHSDTGSVLVLSEQPYCCYHQALISSVLPAGFQVRVIGIKAPEKTPIAVYLKVIAQTVSALAE